MAVQSILHNLDSGRLWASLFIVNCLRKIVNLKKLNQKNVAYNYAAKEKKDQEAREAAQRKEKIIRMLNKEK